MEGAILSKSFVSLVKATEMEASGVLLVDRSLSPDLYINDLCVRFLVKTRQHKKVFYKNSQSTEISGSPVSSQQVLVLLTPHFLLVKGHEMQQI